MIFIREATLPIAIRGFVMPDSDGNYNIYINRDLSEERKLETVEHEKRHIANCDCYSPELVKVIEDRMVGC